jgi:hypothetical protein
VRVLWAEAFEKWIPGLRSDQIKVIMKTKDNPDGLVNIISYDLGTVSPDQQTAFNGLLLTLCAV